MEAQPSRGDLRARIVEGAADLLREHGPAAVTTRAVAERAGVQAPAIYRLFGDKHGLLDAVAEHVMATFVTGKAAAVAEAAASEVDPLDDLRAGWDAQIAFGLAEPALFRLLSDPERGLRSVAVRSGRQVLAARVARVAQTGRLRVSELRAVGLVQAAGTGTLSVLLSTPPEQRDAGLADAAYEAVLAQVLTDAPVPSGGARTSAVVALRALAPGLVGLSPAERTLLAEWLDRATAG